MPELYHFGREKYWFSMKDFYIYMFDGLYQVSSLLLLVERLLICVVSRLSSSSLSAMQRSRPRQGVMDMISIYTNFRLYVGQDTDMFTPVLTFIYRRWLSLVSWSPTYLREWLQLHGRGGWCSPCPLALSSFGDSQ